MTETRTVSEVGDRVIPLDAETLAAYAAVQADFPERLLRCAERQAAHRRAMATRQHAADIALAKAQARMELLALGLALVATVVPAALDAFQRGWHWAVWVR